MKKRKKLSPIIYFALPIYIAVSLLLEAAKRDTAIADHINSGFSQDLRRFMAELTSSVGFSIFECLVYSLLPIAAIVFVLAYHAFSNRVGRLRLISGILSVLLLLLSGNTLCLGIGYRTTSLRSHLSLDNTEVTEDRLASVLIILRDELNGLSDLVEYSEEGTSVGYDLDTTSAMLCEAFSNVSEKYPFFENFDSRVKPVRSGAAMTMLGISGIYTFYTGESNVNSIFPMSELTFVSAHELSHQRGIMRENEANFMAFLVTYESSDIYLRYSGALSMYQYIGSALYRTNEERYREIASELKEGPKADISASNEIVLKYTDTFITDISRFVNDIFLKSNGTAGVITYGEVVKLTVAYYRKEGMIS